MRDEARTAHRKRDGTARIHIEEADAVGPQGHSCQKCQLQLRRPKRLIRDFSIKIMRGDRIGLIGNNGVGKTTLLRLLLGELQPQTGTIKHGTNLEIGYFDQLRQNPRTRQVRRATTSARAEPTSS